MSRGLQTVNLLYGSPNTSVLLLTELPEDLPPGSNRRPYGERGWCLFESTAAAVLKPSGLLLDLGRKAAMRCLADPDIDLFKTVNAGRGKLPVPLAPAHMKRKLENATFTSVRSDRGMVGNKYEQFFNIASATADRLDFTNPFQDRDVMWGDDELQQVAAVLPAFQLCEMLTIARQGFGDRGLGTLCGALPSLGRLRVLVMWDCISFTGSGFEALAGQHMSVLEVLDLSRTGIDDQGVGALAQQLPRFLQLKSLY